jgi:hypothetical protein
MGRLRHRMRSVEPAPTLSAADTLSDTLRQNLKWTEADELAAMIAQYGAKSTMWKRADGRQSFS